MAKILIVCNDGQISAWLEETVKGRGFSCEVIGAEAVAPKKAASGLFSLLVWNHMDAGWDDALLTEVLATNVPVILIGEPLEVDEQVRMLLMGIDDFITMPVHHMELLARIEVALRRHGGALDSVLKVENVTVMQSDHIVAKNGQVVSLAPREYELLTFLLRNRNVTFSRERLLMEVWNVDEGGATEALENGTRTVDAHILRIRRKLGLQSSLQTVYNAGYRMIDAETIVSKL